MSVTKCLHDHDMTEGNMFTDSRGVHCRKCRTEATRRYQKSAAGKLASARSETKRRKRLVGPVVPKRSAVEIKAEWNYMLDQAQANGWDHRRNCFGREAEFVMYDAANAPTPAKAEAMCAGCPLYDLCGEYAAATKPGWGIWGKHVWRYGKIVRREEDMPAEEDEVS